jgi:hypothetical protein
MNPDGTGMLGCFGNSSDAPPIPACARPVPGTSRVVTVLTAKSNINIGGSPALIDVMVSRDGVKGLW